MQEALVDDGHAGRPFHVAFGRMGVHRRIGGGPCCGGGLRYVVPYDRGIRRRRLRVRYAVLPAADPVVRTARARFPAPFVSPDVHGAENQPDRHHRCRRSPARCLFGDLRRPVTPVAGDRRGCRQPGSAVHHTATAAGPTVPHPQFARPSFSRVTSTWHAVPVGRRATAASLRPHVGIA